MMDEDLKRELMRIYATEAADQFDHVAKQLEGLEVEPDSQSQLGELRRSLHTVKGGAYSAGLTLFGDLIHCIEERFEGLPDLPTIRAAKRAVAALLKGIQIVARERTEPNELILSAREAFLLGEDLTTGSRRPAPQEAEEAETVGRVDLRELEQVATRLVESQGYAHQLSRSLQELAQACVYHSRTGANPALASIAVQVESLRKNSSLLERSLEAAGQGSVRMRLRPVEGLLKGLESAFDDAIRRTGKVGRLETRGEEVLLDRRLSHRLHSVLVHAVRNAVDHGFESPEERKAAGKTEIPTLSLRCTALGIRVQFTIVDDGRGIDPEAVRQAARRRGLIGDEELLTDEQAVNLVLRSNLTTRGEATELSGRGVGLDAVRDTVERLNGRVNLSSRLGEGTTIQLRVPVSLATERMLIVARSDQRFALPVVAANRIQSLDQIAIESVGGRRTIKLGQDRITLCDLAQFYELVDRETERLAVIVEVGDRRLALGVDRVDEDQEVSVRPVGEPLGSLPLCSGLAFLRDGSIIPVVDLAELLQQPRQMAQRRNAPVSETQTNADYTVLVVDDSVTTRTLERSALEHVGYRVLTATDGKEACDHLECGEVDLVITDCEMPQMDGIELIRYIRDSDTHAALPVIMVTSRTDMEAIALKAGANHHVVKRAFDQEALLDQVSQLLRKP